MTFEELKTLFSYWVDDLQFGYFTEPQAEVFINNGFKELQKKLINQGQDWYVKIVTRSTIINQARYVLPCDFRKIRRMELVENPGVNESSKQLRRITMNQQDQWGKTGIPEVFYVMKNELVLKPEPQELRTIRMHYIYRAPVMVNPGDVPDAPEEYHELCAIYGALDAFLKDGRDPSLLLEKTKAFEEALKNDFQERIVSQPRFINSQYDDEGGFGVLF